MTLIHTTHGYGQGIYLEWHFSEPDCSDLPGRRSLIFEDTTFVYEALNEWRELKILSGFPDSRIDTAIWSEHVLHAYASCGSQYKWGKIRPGNVPKIYFDENKHSLNSRKPLLFGPEDIPFLMGTILREAENQGYPFAEISLDSVEIQHSLISASLLFKSNQFTRFDSLIVKGDSKTNVRFIQNYLGLRKGEMYDQSLYDKIPNRLRELAFIRQIKPYEVGFRPGKADIYIYIDDRKASNFDGIIGIQPDGNTGKTIFTGDVKLNLKNSFKHGEQINLRWQRLQTKTQQLDLAFGYPYMFNTPLGIDFGFNLYRRDTLFSQIELKLGVQYSFNGSNNVLAYFENEQANAISTQAAGVDFIDSRTNLFGLSMSLNELDYRINPSKGYSILTDVAAGRKHIDNLGEIENENQSDLNQNTDLYKSKLDLSVFLPIGGRSTVLFRNQAALIINELLFRNEVYRIGGLKTIRGFDEQSIFASSYVILTLEYRFLLEENSNLLVFFDQGWYEDKSSFSYLSDRPSSFGAGINFETKAGIFALTYALGNQFDQGFQFRSGKIHFGFTSYF